MKKSIFKLIIVATAVCGCSKSAQVGDVDSNVSIFAILDNGTTTKTVVDNNPTHVYPKGRIGILWNSDDQIGVYSEITKNSAFTSNMISGSTAEATLFSGSLEGRALYAYYPYSIDNNEQSYTEVKGEIPSIQIYNTKTRRIPSDYKVGIQRTKEDGTPIAGSFKFESILALFRVDIDATGTQLAGQNLQRITFTFPQTAVARGQFQINLANRTTSIVAIEGSNVLTMEWEDTPELSSGSQYTGYITCAPIKIIDQQDQQVVITVETSAYVASFKANLETNFEPNTMYTFPLKLSKWAARTDSEWNLVAK